MRLQSAIFTFPDALLDGGALRPGADKVLSILKMESVWLYAVTALDRAEAQALLRSAGIEGDFRGLLTEREAGCAVCSRTMLEKAMRRLRSQKADTVVFTGTLALVETAKKAGFRAVAVGGAEIRYGAFLTAVINFLIMALVIFLLVKLLNRVMTIRKKPEPQAAPTVKKCPFCCSEIPLEATRCPHCTSELNE